MKPVLGITDFPEALPKKLYQVSNLPLIKDVEII